MFEVNFHLFMKSIKLMIAKQHSYEIPEFLYQEVVIAGI
jgi:hypothetical protein